MNWVAISSVIQGGSALVTTLVTVAIYRVYAGQKMIMDMQRAAMDNQRTQQNFIQVMNYMQTDSMRESRARVWTAIGRPEHSPDEKPFSKVMSSFELLSCFVETGVLDQEQLTQYWGPEIVQIYDAAPEKLQNLPWLVKSTRQVKFLKTQIPSSEHRAQ